MSSKAKMQPTIYDRRKYNATELVDFDMGVKYSSVLLAIAGADGELADDELRWYLGEVTLMGASQEYLDAIRNIDWKNVNIEEVLSEIDFGINLDLPRCLLYQAIKMSRADGVYHEKEKAAVTRAAEILGVSQKVVESIEAVAEMEENTERLLSFILSSKV